MGKFPEIVDRIQRPLAIPIPPHFMDHQFMGRAVLPGVVLTVAGGATGRLTMTAPAVRDSDETAHSGIHMGGPVL